MLPISPPSVKDTKFFPFLSSLFITTLIVSNIIAVKIGSFGGYFLPVAVIIFPVSYILGDILTEVYGYAATRRVLWTGFACNLHVVFAIWIARVIPAAPFYEGQTAFDTILGSTPRILAASFVAYLVGGFSNSFIMAKLKIATKGRFLWVRTITSTIVGEGLDSSIFITLAFANVFPGVQIVVLVLTQWIFKVLFEVISTPFTYGIVSFLKKKEQMDAYDVSTNFNPLQI
jgi:uncharacterized integral membrane protein (TIGR00697 family)